MPDAFANYDAAIQTYSNEAWSMLEAARAEAATLKVVPANESDENRKRREERLAKAQGRISAGFSQLGQAAKMQSEQNARAGYERVRQLMEATSRAGVEASNRIQNILATNPSPTTADWDLIAQLQSVLRTIATIAPIAVWTKDSGPSSDG